MKILQWFKSDCIDFTKPDKPVEVKQEKTLKDTDYENLKDTDYENLKDTDYENLISNQDNFSKRKIRYVEPIDWTEIKYATPIGYQTYAARLTLG
jgi:hypothetical protein